ncbi:MAG: hypothetical protein KDK24_05925 [Pseudooceanicola sp.]|nr:hypothetical protein [Pseudooceanicola sp.]
MALTLSFDASALAAFNSRTYFADFFAGLASSDGYFYGGTPDSAFGGTYYMNGSQHVRAYTDGTDPVSSAVLMDGADLAYDFIHAGPAFGHGISGSLDSVTFGEWIDGTTTGTEGTGAAGRVEGFGVGVVIEGFGLSAAVGDGNDGATNPVYNLYKAMQNLDAATLAEVFAGYSVEMAGTAGADLLVGFSHDDALIGGKGADLLRGGAGADVLLGGTGADRVYGGAGADVILGGGGDDVLEGRIGRDILKGGSGDDTLTGGAGTDWLTGGAGADTFVLLTNSGRDIVTDFDMAEDLLDVSALGVSALADFTVTEVGGDTTLVAGSVSITLLGVAEADLTSDVFVF